MRRVRQQSMQSNAGNKENVNYASCASVSIAEEMVGALNMTCVLFLLIEIFLFTEP
jgi:hypothetical protein